MIENIRQLIREKRRWEGALEGGKESDSHRDWYASKSLPHFDRPGVQQFVTFRLADAMPLAKRTEWATYFELEDKREKQRRIEAYIDRGCGECSLRQRPVAEIVQTALWFRDGIDYRLLAWCVMPNHVHVLFEVWEKPLGDIMQAWKGITSNRANRLLGRRGAFWETDYFDTYIRDEKHETRAIRYIEWNPVKARLCAAPDRWPWSSAAYRDPSAPGNRKLMHPTADRNKPEPVE